MEGARSTGFVTQVLTVGDIVMFQLSVLLELACLPECGAETSTHPIINFSRRDAFCPKKVNLHNIAKSSKADSRVSFTSPVALPRTYIPFSPTSISTITLSSSLRLFSTLQNLGNPAERIHSALLRWIVVKRFSRSVGTCYTG